MKLLIQTIAQGDHPAAITQLEEALSQSPTDSQLHYLLGAEYAQVGEYEKAIASMTQAITLNPELHTAIFQLGLLYLTQGQAVEAAQTWAPLAALPENDPLHLFSSGLQHLAKDEFTQCKALLEEGIKNNTSNPALNTDMQRILGEIASLANTPAETPAAVTTEKTAQPVSSVYLQAYNQNADEDDNIIH